jgi:hypothetical protein
VRCHGRPKAIGATAFGQEASSLLADYALAHGLSDLGLARRLGCPVEALAMLRLCRLPRDAGEVAQVAGRFGCDAEALAELAGVGAKGKRETTRKAA